MATRLFPRPTTAARSGEGNYSGFSKGRKLWRQRDLAASPEDPLIARDRGDLPVSFGS
jgi:hypothetical protein